MMGYAMAPVDGQSEEDRVVPANLLSGELVVPLGRKRWPHPGIYKVVGDIEEINGEAVEVSYVDREGKIVIDPNKLPEGGFTVALVDRINNLKMEAGARAGEFMLSTQIYSLKLQVVRIQLPSTYTSKDLKIDGATDLEQVIKGIQEFLSTRSLTRINIIYNSTAHNSSSLTDSFVWRLDFDDVDGKPRSFMLGFDGTLRSNNEKNAYLSSLGLDPESIRKVPTGGVVFIKEEAERVLFNPEFPSLTAKFWNNVLVQTLLELGRPYQPSTLNLVPAAQPAASSAAAPAVTA